MLSKKKILKYIGIVILVKIVVFTSFFLYSIKEVKKENNNKKLTINKIKTIEGPKKKVLSKAQKEEQKNNVIRWKLEHKMKTVYKLCTDSYAKDKTKKEILISITSKLQKLENINIFIANYYEETLFGSNDYQDIHARTVVLEEIQKVRRRGSGFIISEIDFKGTKRYALVQNLEFLDLYVGINFIE